MTLAPALTLDDLDCRDTLGLNPMDYAALSGNKAAQQILYEEVVLPAYESNPENFTLLYFAVATQQRKVVSELLNANVANANRMSFLLVAASKQGSSDIVADLLKTGALADFVQGGRHLWTASKYGHAAVVTQLLEVAPDSVNQQSAPLDEATPLYAACQWGHIDVVRRLLAAKANPDIGNKNGQKPLSIAAQCGHGEIVAELIKAGATLNEEGNLTHNPLWLAAEMGQDEIVKQLLDAGASSEQVVFLGNGMRMSLISFSLKLNHSKAVKTLAPEVLRGYMQRLAERPDEKYTDLRSQFYDFFGAKTDRFSQYQATFALREYAMGRLGVDQLENYHSTLNRTPELKSIYDYYMAHPEIIENRPAIKNSDRLNNYFSAKLLGDIEKAAALENEMHDICSSEKENVAAYISLAIMNSKDESREDSTQSKCHAAQLSALALDPDLSQTKNILNTWINEKVIPPEAGDLFWKRFEEIKPIALLLADETGVEEKEDDFSDIPTFSR
jgi:ankyrin repeat protein